MHPGHGNPPALPRKSLDSSYASSSTEHRRSSSDAATPTQTSHLGRPFPQAVSIQDLKRAAGAPQILPRQQIIISPARYTPARSFTDQIYPKQSPIKATSPRKKTSNPNLLGISAGINSKMHRLAPTTSIASNPSASTLSLPPSTLSSTLSSNSLISLNSVENRTCFNPCLLKTGIHSNLAWQTLHVFVLPLFNGEQLGQPMYVIAS